MNTPKEIHYDSQEAAHKETREVWVSSLGRIFMDESVARYDGCTIRRCDSCDGDTPKGYTKCRTCMKKMGISRYEAMPFKEWDGKEMLALFDSHEFFKDEDDIYAYLDRNAIESSEDMMFVICEPRFPQELTAEDLFYELTDGLELKNTHPEISAALDKLNEAIRANTTPIDWFHGKFRTSVLVELKGP